MPVTPLKPDQLRRVCRHDHFEFETTADLPISADIIGQPRGIRAIEFGIGIQSDGFNIYVLGSSGTGRATAIERYLQDRTKDQPVPDDWVYVHNFTETHKPRAIELPAGQGDIFRERMGQLIRDLQADLPQAFDTDAYESAMKAVTEDLEKQHSQMLQTVQKSASEQGFTIINTPSGFGVAPLLDGRPMQQEEWETLPIDQRQKLDEIRADITEELEDLLDQTRQLEDEVRQQIKQIDREVAESAIDYYFVRLREQYKDQEEILLYLSEVYEDVLVQIDDFAPSGEAEENYELDLRRYEVTVLVKNKDTQGAPVIIEQNPTYHNLIGRLEYEMRDGYVTTHFTNIKNGSLHRANGGYLIMNAIDILKDPMAWEALKRTLKTQQIRVQPLATMDGGTQVLAKSLDPEPIPLNVKIILLGSPALYYALHAQEDDFTDLFKVRSDFDETMPRDDEHEMAYALFVATRCAEEKLHHFDETAVEKIIEFGSRLAEHQDKLSTRFGVIADVVREASYWAEINKREVVTAVDIQQALNERTYRANSLEEDIREDILNGTLFIATEGEVVGQVNGLSVLDTGDYAFGIPGRITARTYMGEEGVLHIERETEMSGPIHEKGFFTLKGYLGGTYALNQPLSLSASLTFEQNYGGVDGDSASSTELYALLSSLSNLPIKQGIAVTGSVNQRGEVQPIGGANEKIEGYFRICKARGLTGEQGVLIPASNLKYLMLHEDVITAVAEGKFNIWPITTVDEGIEILTGTPAGEMDADGRYPENSIHALVQNRLRQLAEDLKNFGNEEEEDEDDSEEKTETT